MEDCQHILKAFGAFDYVAATKLISKITKVNVFIYSRKYTPNTLSRFISPSVISLLDYVVVKVHSHSYNF